MNIQIVMILVLLYHLNYRRNMNRCIEEKDTQIIIQQYKIKSSMKLQMNDNET